MENYIELLKLILPELIVEHFDLVNTKTEQEKMHLFFEEKNTPPKEYNNLQLISKGFLNEITIQDFPLRGKFVYLHIKRRRWTDKKSQEIKTVFFESSTSMIVTYKAFNALKCSILLVIIYL